MSNEIYATLSTVTVELPPESEEQRKKMEETNRQIAGLGFRTFRAATDWGFRPYEDSLTSQQARQPWTRPERKGPVRFQSGDLVKIFKTVSDGDVHWQGTVDYDRSQYHHGWQKGLSEEEWEIMFADALPARLERDGKIIYGALDPFAETGTEGVIWALHEYGKAGYDGLVILREGDNLTVYSEVRDGEVEWQGRVDFGPEKVQKIGWTEVMREAKHVDTQKWLQMSWENRPAAVTPQP